MWWLAITLELPCFWWFRFGITAWEGGSQDLRGALRDVGLIILTDLEWLIALSHWSLVWERRMRQTGRTDSEKQYP